MKTMLSASAVLIVSLTAACSQYTSATRGDTFRGCLQGDAVRGFSLLSPTGDGSGGDSTGQTMTYKVLAGAGVDLSSMVNKTVELTGTLSTGEAKSGSMPAPVPDTVRGTGGSGGGGKPGVDTAFSYANGTLEAKAARELEPTCAVRFAPDRDEPAK